MFLVAICWVFSAAPAGYSDLPGWASEMQVFNWKCKHIHESFCMLSGTLFLLKPAGRYQVPVPELDTTKPQRAKVPDSGSLQESCAQLLVPAHRACFSLAFQPLDTSLYCGTLFCKTRQVYSCKVLDAKMTIQKSHKIKTLWVCIFGHFHPVITKSPNLISQAYYNFPHI